MARRIMAWGLVYLLASPARADSSATAGALPQVPESELAVLTTAEEAIAEARRLQLSLDESGALERLKSAETHLLEHLELPGVGSWLAEVWIAMANAAAQAGLSDLATTLLSRAASIEPERPLEAAEVPPSLALQWSQLLVLQRSLPQGRFEVAIFPESAALWIDGRPYTTRYVSLSPGPHLLQIHAADHASLASIIDVWSGERPRLEIILAPRAGNVSSGEPVKTLEPQKGPRLAAAERVEAGRSVREQDQVSKRWRKALAWSGAAAILASASVWLAVSLQKPEPTPERVLVVDPGSAKAAR